MIVLAELLHRQHDHGFVDAGICQAPKRLEGSWLPRLKRDYLASPLGAVCTGRRIGVGPNQKRVVGMAEQLPAS